MNMKLILPLLAGLSLLTLAAPANARRNKTQQEGYVFKYKTLPRVNFFKTDNYGYMDIGFTFNSMKIFGVPLWNSDVKWCGYVGQEKRYIYINPSVVRPRIVQYNKEAKKNKWTPIDPATVTNNREAWHALITMYNNVGKTTSKGTFKPLDIKLPATPPLPFWYRVGGKLVAGLILLIILIGGGFGSMFNKKKKKKEKEKKEETVQA